MSWTQPLCTDCWIRENLSEEGVRIPTRVVNIPWEELLERCCECGRMTSAGIFTRKDPKEVPYPRENNDD